MRQESLDFLKELLTTPTPSGFESKGQKVWCDYVRQFADEVTTDEYGNAIAVLNPQGKIKVLLDGHMDEIGLMVKYIDDKGFVYVQSIGGVNPAHVQGKRLNIHTTNGVVRGVIGATAPHLRDRENEPKTPKMHQIFVDVGATKKEEAEALVAIGDPATFVDDFEMLNDNVAVARALDDRIGCWIAAEAMRIVKEKAKDLNVALYLASSIQEETGCNGAKMNVDHVKPHVAIAVEVTHATDTPGIDNKLHGQVKMGHGPTVSIGREHHPVVVRRLREVAEKNEIKYQVETFSKSGGTNAISMWTYGGGTPAALISLPNRYMHSTVEMCDMRDLQASIDWLAAFVMDIKEGEEFKVQV